MAAKGGVHHSAFSRTSTMSTAVRSPFQGSCSVEGTDHGKADKEQGKRLFSGLQSSPPDWRDLTLCQNCVLGTSH